MTNSFMQDIPAKEKNTAPKRILLTGARSPCALELARNLHHAGHHVIAADTSTFHPLRFSKAVDNFLKIPSPRYQPEEFTKVLSSIIRDERIDLLIPVWEEVLYISRILDQIPKGCEVFCSPFSVVHALHNKWLFTHKLKELGFNAPRALLIEGREDLDRIDFDVPYVLKACYSRASQHVYIIQDGSKPPVDASPQNPWLVQEFISGEKYCSYSICHKGKVLAHSSYPVEYTIDGNSCLAFVSVRHPGILQWVERLVEALNFTGQISFDFIENQNKELYAIECNPRATSGVHLFRRDDPLDKAFLHQTESTIFPKEGNSQQIALGMCLYGLRRGFKEKRLGKFLRKLLTTKDVVYSSNDLKPFLSEPLIFSSYLYRCKRTGLPLPAWFTHDLDWNSTPG